MSNIVNIFVVSPDTRSERRLDLHTTIGNLKGKLELITGVPVSSQSLALYSTESDTTPIAELADDAKPLGFYGAQNMQMIKARRRVTDLNPSVSFTGQLTDTSQVDKFELTEEEYAARADTVLAYKQRNKVGRFADQAQELSPSAVTDTSHITLGARCEVESNDAELSKRGVVRFVGQTQFGDKSGVWVGVEYDEPLGKNDGSVQGVRYFECRPKYGVFVRPNKVKVGDYPVEDLLEDEEM
ncbi:hypothetical protein CYLTODRAFT_399892 [Cylindrobasidium torrendii FP15055 ss-10]|uniref:CAP-Gly domain-containing protein n=1 Tax=Cylindrobasidium torrendii FP15055 ss-10 TaxID=1314674 RepID=A0A0D7B5G2_9AGAR|nr:hypothetical protein CYLTODRAFT_399892 [Cylindrobasidium torrendii FP15055 ss-10]